MQVPCHACLRGAIFLGEPWQDCDAEIQELLWGDCKLAFVYTSRSESHYGLKIPHGVLSMHCHSSALIIGLRSLLLRMELAPSSIAVFGPAALHPAAAELGMQVFATVKPSHVTWIIASSHRSNESPLVGVAMSEHRWRDFLRRGFFPCVPCFGVSFARIQLSAPAADLSSFDILLHKASDFLEGMDSTGTLVLPEALTALLHGADGSYGHPLCLDPPHSLVKVVNREIMYATLHTLLNPAGGTLKAATPPFFKAYAGEQMTAVWPKAQDRGMALPLLIKPLPACSLPGAHKFQLIESLAGSDDIKQDSIVQPYVPHDGFVRKVCVVGSQVYVSERDSSKSILKSEASEGCIRSRYAGSNETELAISVKEAFDMEILGFDVIKDSITGIDYVVDVNHLPSLKDFPEAKDALWSLCRALHASRPGMPATIHVHAS